MFTFVLFSIVVLFITTLTKSHWASIKSVESLENKPPAPPPAWESFSFLKRYHGGIRTLVSREENKPEYPADEVKEEKGAEEQAAEPQEVQQLEKPKEKREIKASKVFNPYTKGKESRVECFLDEEKKVKVPHVHVFPGVPSGMPEAVMGSSSILGLSDDICFDRYGRLGPYGYGYSKKLGGTSTGMSGDREGIEAVWAAEDYVDYSKVKWGDAVTRCEAANKQRFTNNAKKLVAKDADKAELIPGEEKSTIPKTAVIIRTWADYNYDDEDILYLRSLVAELALQTGGEYSVHFLIHVKDRNTQIWADKEIYQRVLNESLPEEFYGMGTLWTEKQMELVYAGLEETNYRDLKVYGVYRSTFQPMSYFALQHPEYEYYWQLEMDARYTGHWYHLFDRASQWAAKQPRKGLWERNSRFYIPSEHGSWEDFSHMVRVQTEHGTASKSNMYAALANSPSVPDAVKSDMQPAKPEKPVWGPESPLDDTLDTAHDGKPPTTEKEDKGVWGVDEEADLILFNPIFDPEGTNWLLANDVTGYNKTRGLPPRRTAINTFGRYSRRLLMQMHTDTVFSRKSMFSEMWPATTSLHHGFKAVYVPHPVFIDRRWPTAYLASIMNGGRNGAAGGARLSVFSEERQHNFRGTTWYYDAGFAPNLWKRWFGQRIDGDGGEAEEEAGEGRMCLPAVLLHPVKQVDLLVERLVEDVQ